MWAGSPIRFTDIFRCRASGEHKAKAHTVFATVVSREFISGYQELFGKLGITVDSVECASGAMIRLLGILSQVNDAKRHCTVCG